MVETLPGTGTTWVDSLPGGRWIDRDSAADVALVRPGDDDSPMLTDPIRIRCASLDDARTLAEIHVESWRVAYVDIMPREWLDGLSVEERTGRWGGVLSEGQSSTLLACAEANPVGWIHFGPCRDAETPIGWGEVYGFYLRPAYWGRGVGRQLWSAAIDELTRAGYKGSVVWTLEQNTRARRFYERMGTTLSEGVTRLVGRDDAKLVEVRYLIAPREPI